jgi:hypothetical protein
MSKTAREVPPRLELRCLKALWPLREGNVKDVQQAVAQTRPLAHTTIPQRQADAALARPGVRVCAHHVGRRHAAVRELEGSFFDGSAETLERCLSAPEMPRPRGTQRGRRWKTLGSTRCWCKFGTGSGRGRAAWPIGGCVPTDRETGPIRNAAGAAAAAIRVLQTTGCGHGPIRGFVECRELLP